MPAQENVTLVSPEADPPQKKVEDLIELLIKVKTQFPGKDHPGLVEIDSALVMARQLKTFFDFENRKVDWKEIGETILFVMKVVVEIYSLLSYYSLFRGGNAPRQSYKVTSGGGRAFPTGSRRFVAYRPSISITA
jgi:hypothetical protein